MGAHARRTNASISATSAVGVPSLRVGKTTGGQSPHRPARGRLRPNLTTMPARATLTTLARGRGLLGLVGPWPPAGGRPWPPRGAPLAAGGLPPPVLGLFRTPGPAPGLSGGASWPPPRRSAPPCWGAPGRLCRSCSHRNTVRSAPCAPWMRTRGSVSGTPPASAVAGRGESLVRGPSCPGPAAFPLVPPGGALGRQFWRGPAVARRGRAVPPLLFTSSTPRPRPHPLVPTHLPIRSSAVRVGTLPGSPSPHVLATVYPAAAVSQTG